NAVHQRTRALGRRGPVGGHLGRTGVAGRDLGAARIEDAVLDLGAHEALVTGQLGLGQHLLHATDTSCAGSPRLPGPAIPPDASASCSSSCWRRPALSTLSGVSSNDWMSISPSRQSSNSSCSANESDRIVGASVIRLVALRWN